MNSVPNPFDSGLEKNSASSAEDERLLRFLSQYNAHYRYMYLYAKTLFPSENDADDLVQEASLILWKKFDDFQPGSNFTAWAFQIIRIVVMRRRKQIARERHYFSEEFLNTVADSLEIRPEDDFDLRYESLSECLKTLSPKMRQLVFDKYFEGKKIIDISKRIRCNVEAVYQQLSRIRKTLRNCVNEKMIKLEEN